MGISLESGDVVNVDLLSVVVLMRWYNVEVNFFSRKIGIQRIDVNLLKIGLETFHFHRPLTNRVVPCVQILDASHCRYTRNVESDLTGETPVAVRFGKFLILLVQNTFLLWDCGGWFGEDNAGLDLGLQKVRRG